MLPLNQHALGVMGDVAYHGYEGAATRLASASASSPISATAASWFAQSRVFDGREQRKIERACEMQLALQQSGAEFFPVPETVVQEACARAKNRFAGGGRNDPASFEWPALLRKLDRIDPSYKQRPPAPLPPPASDRPGRTSG